MNSEDIRKMLDEATPGPWDLFHVPEIPVAGITSRTGDICKMSNHYEWRGGETVTNARLIAAAPDLAAEVLRLREALETCAAEIFVPVATSLSGGIDHEEMYDRWRDIACDRADIARAALGDSHE